MGAAIAGHCANAGLEVDLLDIAARDGDDKNEVVKGGFDRMKKARPPALMSKRALERMRIGNFEEDLGRVAEADWILEAIIEKLEPKQALMTRVEELAKSDAIISSNTSGIPLHSIAEDLPDSFKKRFLGTHFFNPPRYLKLLEIIPTEDTDPDLVKEVRAFGERVLGKGGVRRYYRASDWAPQNRHLPPSGSGWPGHRDRRRPEPLRPRPRRRVARATTPPRKTPRDAGEEPTRCKDRRRFLQARQT
jgi:3-hydroxyacyl-CoA dehydrogenase